MSARPARVNAAKAAGPRRTLTGQPLPAKYEQIAAGQADGTVSAPAARLIADTLERLPQAVPAHDKTWAEQFLATQAGVFDLDSLRKLAVRVSDTLDPDGLLKDHDYRRDQRALDLHVRRDGSATLRGEATAELTEHLRTLFDTLARPLPQTDGLKDQRSGGQHRHDALLDALKRLERANGLPEAGGVSATILLTMTVDAYTHATSNGEDDGGDEHDGGGTDDPAAATAAASSRRSAIPGRYAVTGGRLARTGHGVLIPAAEALRWAGGQARVMRIVFNTAHRVEAYGTAQRLFTEGQRLAMAARDLGCSFPGCDVPPARCEAHHVTDWTITRRTTVDDGTLACDLHHREHERTGWTCTMINKVPHWIPPSGGPPADEGVAGGGGSTRNANPSATTPTTPSPPADPSAGPSN